MPRAVFDQVMTATHGETPPDPVLLDLAWAIIEAGAATAGRHPEAVETVTAATIAGLAAFTANHAKI